MLFKIAKIVNISKVHELLLKTNATLVDDEIFRKEKPLLKFSYTLFTCLMKLHCILNSPIVASFTI